MTHSIRSEGTEGFVLPYHDYLEPTDDAEEDERRSELVAEIALVPDPAHLASFSYAGELADADVALSTLVRALDVVRTIRSHGIVPGPWEQREEWLNEKIDTTWHQRGAFPGTGGMLEALGCRLGTSLVRELLASGKVGPLEDPWPLLDSMLRGTVEIPPHYRADLAATANTYAALSDERRDLLKMLSRFSLTAEQSKRWWDRKRRAEAVRATVSEAQILENPYRVSELDLGGHDDWPISVGVIDRGVMPDSTVAAACPIEGPAAVSSPNDARRVRATLVAVLRRAADEGDALLTASDAIERVDNLDLERAVDMNADWLAGNSETLEDEIVQADLVLDPAGRACRLRAALGSSRTRDAPAFAAD